MKIAVTSAMTAAGIDALYELGMGQIEDGAIERKDLVETIFVAMMRARPADEITPEMIEAGAEATAKRLYQPEFSHSFRMYLAEEVLRCALTAPMPVNDPKCPMSDASPPYDGKCPQCGHQFSLVDLKRMAVGDGWQRYIFVERDSKVEPVSFTDYDPVNMRPRGS